MHRHAFLALLLLGCGSSTFGADAGTDAGADAPRDVATADAPSDGPGFGDVQTGDAGCTALNIGILGNPGQNQSANFQQWLVNAGTSVTRIETGATDPPITAGMIAGFDVIILDWLARDYSSTEASVLQSRVAAGAGLISMTGYNNTSADWRANVLLAPLSVAYSGSLLSGPVTTFAAHPITAGLTSVTFEGGYAISDLGGGTSTRTPIAFLGAATVGYAIQYAAGRAFVWGDEWIEFDSEWTTQPEIKQLWVNVFGWIAPQGCPLQPN